MNEDVSLAVGATMAEQREEIILLRAEIEKLRAGFDVWQDRFGVLSETWDTGDNETILETVRLFVKAADGDAAGEKARELVKLKEQLELDRHLLTLAYIDPDNLVECLECEDPHAFEVVRGLCVSCAAKELDRLRAEAEARDLLRDVVPIIQALTDTAEAYDVMTTPGPSGVTNAQVQIKAAREFLAKAQKLLAGGGAG